MQVTKSGIQTAYLLWQVCQRTHIIVLFRLSAQLVAMKNMQLTSLPCIENWTTVSCLISAEHSWIEAFLQFLELVSVIFANLNHLQSICFFKCLGYMSSWGLETNKFFWTFWLTKNWKRRKIESSKSKRSDLSLCYSQVMYYTIWIMGVEQMQPGCDMEGIRPFVIRSTLFTIIKATSVYTF